jgi:hypothetical protein
MAKLSDAQRQILEAARDKGSAYAIFEGYRRTNSGGATGRCIKRLMSRDLLWSLPGPKWATLTDAGRAALAQAEALGSGDKA